MSLQQVPVVEANGSSKPDVLRRSANFHPSVWGNYFLKYASESLEVDINTEQQVDKMKKDVKMKLEAASNPSEKLELIDLIQRLGVSYHFEREIDELLKELRKDCTHLIQTNESLHGVSLLFRLLRQGGYNISSEIFNKYTNKQGKWKKEVVKDVEGMLSLYEASHYRRHGEQILEEALEFTTAHLPYAASIATPFVAAQIKHALTQPIRTGLPRLEARHFISIYHLLPSHHSSLLAFAKLDFNSLQKMHQIELSHISRWWRDLDLASKLTFARDRVVEGYFWILGVYFEPKYAVARIMSTKVIAVTSIIDDIYDVYGTFDELQLFTDAIQRWEMRCMNQLPEYMQYSYATLLDVYQEIEQVVTPEGRSYSLYYAKQEMKKLVQAYFDEAKWYHEKYVPRLEEYMEVSLESAGYAMLTATCFVGMGEIATEKAFDWASKRPKILNAASTIARLANDMVGHKGEQERGHVASSIECYMEEHGVAEEEACGELRNQIEEAWKDINEEFSADEVVASRDLQMRIVNLCRVIDVVYKHGDGYTNASGSMKHLVSLLLLHPIPI